MALRTSILAACTAAVLTATVAVAAAPVATTGPATDVAATSVTLTGTVSPNGEATTYSFQYGATTAYGSQTTTEGPVQGNADRSVSTAVTGLAPSTTYHYRLVATNPSGTVNGADMTFTTPAVGAGEPALTATANRRTVTFGRAVTISGALTGPGNGGQRLTLEQQPAPYNGGFKSTGLSTTTDASGNYTITVGPSENVHYRLVTEGKKPVTSTEVAVRVRVKVTMRVSDRTPRAGRRVRFSGTVLPGHDGAIARIQRRKASGGWSTVARKTLVAASPVGTTPRSRYTRAVRIRRSGTYRVRVAPGDASHIAGNSARRSIKVH